MLDKKQFSNLYNLTVNQVRKIKASNDFLNKEIGVQSDSYLLLQLQQQNEDLKQDFFSLDQNIKKLEKSYLDPDTARKMGTLKQQYRLQSDRRFNLSESIKNNASKHDKAQSMKNMNNLQITSSRYGIQQENKKSNSQGNSNYQSPIKSPKKYQIQQTKQDTQDIQIQHYELQNKLLNAKTLALSQMEHKMYNIQNITNQTLKMAIQQGQNLDIITQDMSKASENVFKAKHQLDQAQIRQKKSKKKYIVASLILIIIAIIILILIFV